MSLCLQLELCSILLSRCFSQSRMYLGKDILPHSAPTISRLLLLEIRVLRGLSLLRTPYRVNGVATLLGRKVTLPSNAPIHTTALLRQLCPPLRLPVGLILFLLLLDRTMFMERSITSHWRKPRKLQTWSLVHFSSMTHLLLCYLILEHRILSYPLHMLRSIIYP
jgi:hypothetical protein